MISLILPVIEKIPHLKFLFAIVGFIVILEVILYNYRRKVKTDYKAKKPDILSFEEAERASLQYFSQLHVTGLVRTSYIVVLGMLLVALYDVRAFSFFAVAFGAILIALRDVIVSMVAYPHVVLSYDIGDDVKVASQFGEIVRVHLLSTHLAGKDERGEHDGKLHVIPNSRFILEPVEKQDVKNRSYRKIELRPVFNPEEYEISFDVWLSLLKEKLNTLLSKRSLKDVGNFKSHSGLKYKLQYEYDKDGCVVIQISFITSVKSLQDKKEQIVSFIESTKKQNKKR
jgi:hypothetical protein